MKLKQLLESLETVYKDLKKGSKITVHKHGNIFIPGTIINRKGDYISYESDDKTLSGSVNLNNKDLKDKIQFNLPATDDELYKDVIDTYKHRGKRMSIGSKKDYNLYKKLSDKEGFVVVYSWQGYSVGLTDEGKKHFNLE